ncbi:sugar phosphate nucleotidyltransferase [Terasakiella sp. SH-1]|uniref:sugar phosphate nucleotidyltransferase n=1 Tax=Terasakiella sp. SH-1 TaxID=2560057 RepID=UPI0010739985|nr:sugar phosphate nucleotidyltransferase [Terasakiella sp. SH-1]
MTMIRPVVLAGGDGSHVHPSSSPATPKQFQPLFDEDSPFQDTMERVNGPEFSSPLVFAPQALAGLVQEQCDEIALEYEALLLEKAGSQKAASIVTAALWAEKRGETNPLLVCPADHYIADPYAFMRAVGDAIHTAQQGYLVAFGTVADRAQGDYGYLEVGLRLHTEYSGHHVECFMNKPGTEQAEALLAQGRFVWNTGIVCFTPDIVLAEIEKCNPHYLAACRQMLEGGDLLDYAVCSDLSLEQVMLEHSGNLAVVSLLSAWSDLENIHRLELMGE